MNNMKITGSSAGSVKRRLATVSIAAAAMAASVIGPADAHSPPITRDEVGVGFFYGTFGESPNAALLVGGPAQDFCEDNPDDPFGGEPGTSMAWTRVRNNGSVVVKVNDPSQPIYLYYTDIEGAPPWIEEVCDAYFENGTVPEPFATGSARLKVFDVVHSEDLIEVYNSVRGTVTSPDGTRYRVRAFADLVIESGVPVGDPADFVFLQIKKIGR